MKTSRIICTALTLLGIAACTATDETADGHSGSGSDRRVQVAIGASQQTSTRTALDPDGRTTRWSSGDRIALWASDGEGNHTLDGEPFSLYTFNGNYSSADFTATIEPMAEGTYTYHAVYPVPEQHTGTQVTYQLPATQSGSYDGTADIMVSTPITGEALGATPKDGMTLAFRHLCHALRIEIPTGRNLFGRPVKRLEIVFPTAVVGTLTFDAAAPDVVPTLTEGSNTVTIDLPGDGLTDAADTYAWIFVAPVTLQGEVLFRAYDAAGFQASAISTTIDKVLTEGHTTPLRLTVPTARPVTYLDFTVSQNNLGEELTDLHLTATTPLFVTPFGSEEGSTADLGKTSEGTFRAAVYADTHSAEELQNLPLTVAYESTNALLSGHTLTLPASISDGAATPVSITVPYLMDEDFSGITSFNYRDNSGSGSDASNPDAIDLSEWGLAGWTGARVGGDGGNAVRVCCHYEGAGLAYGRYDGRMDSAPLTGIKEGKSVKVRVTYNYDGGTTRSDKDTSPTFTYGYTTEAGGHNGSSGISNTVESGIVLSKDHGYGQIEQTKSFDIEGCTSAHRLSWKVSNNRSGWTSYFGDYFLYLDNVKVQIIP